MITELSNVMQAIAYLLYLKELLKTVIIMNKSNINFFIHHIQLWKTNKIPWSTVWKTPKYGFWIKSENVYILNSPYLFMKIYIFCLAYLFRWIMENHWKVPDLSLRKPLMTYLIKIWFIDSWNIKKYNTKNRQR